MSDKLTVSSVGEKKESILLSIDAVGDSIVSLSIQPIVIRKNELYLLVTGWVIDERVKSLLDKVYVCLDGEPYLATYGISRPDVANHFNDSKYIACGFRIVIPLEGVSFGWHTLSIDVISLDGGRQQGLFPVTIFRQGNKRGMGQLLLCEVQQLLRHPAKFFQRGQAAFKHVLRYGPWSFLEGYLDRMYRVSNNVDKYRQWIAHFESPEVYKTQRTIRFKHEPLISIIVPVFETPEDMLKAMVQSVIDQTYGCWELCIVEGASLSKHINEVLKSFEEMDQRIKILYISGNQGISGNSNAAIAMSSGEFIAFLDHDDLLSADALFEMVRAINRENDADLLYSDEDIITQDGKIRLSPYFKPDYSPDTLRTGNYISHLMVLRKELLDEVGWLRSEFDGAQDYDLVLRASENARKVIHVTRILYHWRAHGVSTASGKDVKPYAVQAGRRALQEHLGRIGLCGEVDDDEELFLYKVNYALKDQPLVSIIIPNNDQAAVFSRCLVSVLDKSTYKNFEVIVVENNSKQKKTFAVYEEFRKDPRVRIIPWDEPFNFSALNNFAVSKALGEVLVFLNNDTEVISNDWLESMLQYALRPDVGAVGAKLYYPNNTLQHAGVIIGLGGVAGHVLKYHDGNQGGEFTRLKRVQNYSAVTAACLMMRRSVFEEVNGFNETLAIAFNDVDLCLKVREKGYLVVWTPYAQMYHHESKTRGHDNTSKRMARFSQEINTFKERWPLILDNGDPYYNPNLTLDTEDFSIIGINEIKALLEKEQLSGK